MKALILQFLRFGVVGTLGFLVDAGTLLLAVMLGAGPYGGRALSYLVAASAVYALNRAWTFRDRVGNAPGGSAPVARQWGAYLVLNLIGFGANYGTYAALVAWTEIGARHLVLSVAAGSVAGMFINFAIARQFIFRPAPRGA